MKKLFILPILLIPFKQSSSQQLVNFIATEACFGEQTYLVGQSDSVINSWKWDLDNDGQTDDAFSQNAFYTYTQSGSFQVTLVGISQYGNSDTITKSVTVNPVPQVNFQADNLCAGKAAIYQSTSTIGSGAIDQYKWDFNNDGQDDDISGPVVSYTCGPPQTYISKLTCVSDKGCTAFSTKTTKVYPQPTAKFTTSNVCDNETAAFTNESDSVLPSDINLWNFGESQPVSSYHATHLYSAPGYYTVTLITVTQNNCKDTVIKPITVFPLPVVTLALTGDSVLFEGDNATLSATGLGLTYLWSNGETNSTISVASSGNYFLTATDANSCTVSDTISVTFQDVSDSVQIINDIVTPNNDGTNDALLIKDIILYSKCDVSVYNVWGDKVYSNSAYNNDWKGTNSSGKDLPAGAYYYIIKCDDKGQLAGNVNILR
ncbi:MAG: gliding motility-associated C-terminal domain-containing protein [Bacteroidetes bacterium]|nr:gliding motility-associated C-terminal domain-containing protein [Bacteroidota bacterium]